MKGPICGVENCRSRNYEEGEDGFLYCQNGHRQHGLVRGDDDEDNFSTATRTVTRKKKETENESQKVAKHFSGRPAFDLYLKCLQLVLRHQLWFLTKERGLPAELEIIVFDLWALRIAQFGDKIANSQQEFQLQSQSQAQVYNTLESDSEATDVDKSKSKDRRAGKEKALANLPYLTDCLALCYLGILTLRLPFTPGDIHKWTVDRKLHYIGAKQVIPLSMRDRLPPQFHAALEPRSLPKYSRFYATLTDLRSSYSHEYGILWPALNAPLLLFRCLKELALPLEVYDATLRLKRLLSLDFTFSGNGKKRTGVRYVPEAQFIGCLIVCVKLLYPMDDEDRRPAAATDSTAVPMNWKSWCNQMTAPQQEQRGHFQNYTSEELLQMRDDDVFSMKEGEMDQYLDFYADAFLDDAEIQRTKDNNDFRRALYDMFPIGDSGHKPIQTSATRSSQEKFNRVAAVQNCVKAKSITTDDTSNDTSRPGQAYPSWKKEEELPDYAKAFYHEAAELIGLSIDMLILAVCSIEAKIEQWRRQQRNDTAIRDDEYAEDAMDI